MEKIIIEVGSTCTKVDLYDEKEVKHIETRTIEFKRNFKKENKLDSNDVNELINLVKECKEKYGNVYICGTSVFRNLTDEQKKEFLDVFYKETKVNFDIISPEKENELTVYGAVRKVNQKVAVFIGGGGSTEIAIYDNGIKEMVNTPFGVIDIMNKYPDLGEDLATTKLEKIREEVKEKLNIPKEKADILILAGGGHKLFALESLDEIRSRVEDPNWWYATRAMSAFALDVAEEIGAKYIVPTDISMVYGLINNEEK